MLADQLFLGHDLLAWLVLAFGGALLVGNLAAIIRPPVETDAETPPTQLRRRALIYAGIGAVAAIWALATLVTG
ncbi:MAG TPA: hypothetical protein VFN21_10465 [Acidimicrobiales bacterium]|nr:hypothetical protein [Acidimicrobiales bacterium]